MKLFDRLPRQPFVGVALAATAGILIADRWPITSIIVVLVGAVAAVAGLLLRRSVIVHLLVAVGFFWMHSLLLTDSPGLRLAEAMGETPRVAVATGTVVTEPKVSPSGYSTFLLELRSIDFGGMHLQTKAKLFVRWRGQPEFAQQLRITGQLEPIPPPRNPGEFDLRDYLSRSDVRRQLFARYAEQGRVLEQPRGHLILRLAQASRKWMERTLSRGLEDSPDVQALINATVLGTREQKPQDIEEPFQQTGTLHLFSVSGLHVAILAQLLWVVTRLVRLRRQPAVILIIPVLLFYAAVTGLSTASVRAALMTSVVLGGMFVERRAFSFNSLAAVAVLILAWETNELFSVGFQLSFCVVAAILLAADPIDHLLQRRVRIDPFLPRNLYTRTQRWLRSFLKWLVASAAVSLAAWLGSLPLIAAEYSLVTPISLFANLVVVPLAYGMLAAGMLSLLAAPLSTFVSVAFNNANWVFAKAMFGAVHLFAAIPGGHFYVGPPHLFHRPVAEITVLDVGAGAAIHLRNSDRDWLLDTGSARNFDRVVARYLRSRGVNRLAGVILTHGDSQHLGGAIPAIDTFRPRLIFDNPAPDRSRTHQHLLTHLAERRRPPGALRAGDILPLGQNIRARILFPPAHHRSASADDQSLVIQLEVQGLRVLLTSDSGEQTERWLLENRVDLKSEVIVKGQRPGAISGSPEFLDAVAPQLVITTSRNFPASERISDSWDEMIRRRSSALMRQDRAGAVQLKFFHDHWEADPYLDGETFRSSNR